MSEENVYGNVEELDLNAHNDITEKKPGTGLALASLICGIVSLVGLGWIGPTIWGAIICGVLGCKKYPMYTGEYKKCKLGIVLAIIALALGIIQGIILGLFIVLGPMVYFNS